MRGWFADRMDDLRDFWPAVLVFVVIAGVVAVLVAVFVGHENGIHEGNVADKEHHSAYSSVLCTGKPVICTTPYHPERWEVTIQQGDDKNSFNVEEVDYERLEKGDHIKFDGDTLVK